MSGNVGIVIVSHSPDVARGTAEMVRQMVGDQVPLAWCGGDSGGGLGTSVEAILRAIDAAWSERGVAILFDLGGAETNSEMAIEMQPAERQGRIVLCDAPLVEGAVMAATEASGGATLDQVKRTAEDWRRTERAQGTGAAAAEVTSVPIRDPLGLHARPAVKVTQLAKRFSARVEFARSPAGPWVDAKSIRDVSAARVPRDAALHIRAAGEDAAAAAAALAALIARNFEEEVGGAASG
jgi:dihydroxyacetone kinase phosphotransfer subunit